MAADLGVGREALLGAFTGKRQSMAIHHYPPCRHPDKVIGNTAHTDGLALTVLLPVDDTPGLQVLRGGRWFPVRPRPGALVVVTNGTYRSVEHRVVVSAGLGRTTAVVFQDASVGGLVAPLPELLRGGGEARYRSIPRFEYLKVRFSALAKRTGFLESLKL
jgi:isopenicillin N synthase-like dioxygenase